MGNRKQTIEAASMKAQSKIQTLFKSIDLCMEKCAEIEHLLSEKEDAKKTIICISLCRDFTDLAPMLGPFMVRNSLFAVGIGEVLQEIAVRLAGSLSKLKSVNPEINQCAEMLVECASKINYGCVSQHNSYNLYKK